MNYVIFFWTIPDPYPPLCHLVSSFDIPPPTPLPDDVIYEQENDMSMINYFVRRTLTAHCPWLSFIWEQFLMPHCYISMVRVSYSSVSAFSLLPLASLLSCHLLPDPLPPSVIFCPLLAYSPYVTAPYVRFLNLRCFAKFCSLVN